MAQSLKRKASAIIEMEPDRQYQAVDAQQSFTSARDDDQHDDLPVDRHKIDPELLDVIPEEYFDVQHPFWCSCVGCRLLRPP